MHDVDGNARTRGGLQLAGALGGVCGECLWFWMNGATQLPTHNPTYNPPTPCSTDAAALPSGELSGPGKVRSTAKQQAPGTLS